MTIRAQSITQPHSRRWERWSLLPLIALTIYATLMMVGWNPVPSSWGAATDQKIVTAIVDADLHVVSSCSGTALTIPALDPDGTPDETSTDCSITFGTSDPLGALLRVSDASAGAAPGRAAMVCTSPGSCGTSTLADRQGNPGFNGSQAGFGMRLNAIGGAAANTWSINTSSAPNGQFYDVQDTPDTACSVPSTTDGNCDFRFAAAATSGTAPGSYQADVFFDMYAN